MLGKTSLGVLFSALLLLPLLSNSAPVFINELHYDNTGSDAGEAVELAGFAGVDITDWQLLFYNGMDGSIYRTVTLGGVFNDVSNGYGFLTFDVAGIQNGSPDGIALVDDMDAVMQFISYEGYFEATSGAAAGLFSHDIGLAESSSTLTGQSIQLAGSGYEFSDFYWMLDESSFGFLNTAQEFDLNPTAVSVVSAPGVATLMLPLLFWMIRKPA